MEHVQHYIVSIITLHSHLTVYFLYSVDVINGNFMCYTLT
jgi:hypothetical protein